MAGNAPSAAPSGAVPEPESWAAWSTRNATEISANVAKFLVDVPVECVKGISEGVWKSLPNKEDVNAVLQYLIDAPQNIRDLFMSAEIKEVKTLQNLTDDVQWIEAFDYKEDGQSIFDLQKTEEDLLGVYGPKELLLSLPIKQRKMVFADHVRKIIPQKLWGEMCQKSKAKYNVENIFGDPIKKGDKPAEIKEKGNEGIFKNKDIFIEAMQKIHGMDIQESEEATRDVKESDAASLIARYTLRKHYLRPKKGDDYEEDFAENDGRQIFEDDMQDARRSGVRFDESFLENYESLADKISPSRFRGALRLGLAETGKKEQMRALLKHVNDRLDDKFADEAVIHTAVGKRVEEATHEMERKNRLEAKTMRQVWDDLPAYGKLIIAAAGLYVAFKNKGLAAGMVGMYAFQKFALKHDKPTEMWAKTLQNVAQGAWGPAGKIAEKAGLKDPELCNAQRVSIMNKYLSETERREFENASTGYTLLSDVPINELLMQFDPSADGRKGKFSVPSGSPLDRSIRNALSKQGNSTYEYTNLFNNPDFCNDTADALAHLCYSIGAEADPEAAKIVEENLPAGGSYDDIPDGEVRDAYVRLVQHGKANSNTKTETLMQYVQKSMDSMV